MVYEIIPTLINEIRTGLENNLYLIALNTAIILPDICGLAEYPTEKNKQRYELWYHEYVYKKYLIEENSDISEPLKTDLNKEVIYQLRCSLLHEGNPKVKEQFGSRRDDTYFFRLNKNGSNTYKTHFSLDYRDNYLVKIKREYNIDVSFLCKLLCNAAFEYYKSNKDKFINANLIVE